MVKALQFAAMTALVVNVLVVCACDDESGSKGPVNWNAGDTVAYTADSVSFNMVYVPGGVTFPTGDDDSGTATVENACWIGETEVTYELCYKVYLWARSDDRGSDIYTFSFGSDYPRAGNDGAPGTETNSKEPVTTINWRHAMIWCNALTEWYNANNGSAQDLDCVYYTDSDFVNPIRSADDANTVSYAVSGSQDNPFVKDDAKGFRMVSNNEWELAARWAGTDAGDRTDLVSRNVNGGSASLTEGYYWTPGDYASGSTADYHDIAANSVVAWCHASYSSTVGGKEANGLGLYDMSGNVWEWCFDWYPEYEGLYRSFRGGSWDSSAYSEDLEVGNVSPVPPNNEYAIVGFRFARWE